MILTRYFLASAALLFIADHVSAQTTQKLNIDGATVFLNGAELVSSAQLTLAKGENDILFTNVAGDVSSQSLTVNATNGVVVEAATFQNNYLASENVSPRAQALKDSIELVTAYKEVLANKIAVLTEEVEVLQANRKVSGNNAGLSVTELTKMLDLVSTKMEAYLNQKNKETASLKKADERITKLKKQLDEEQKKDYQPGGQLLVKFYAKEAIATSIVINYVVPHAGWSPTYDIIAEDANSPVKLFYKANIYQNSGVRWNNVRLTLSTGNPNEGAQAPVMSPWYLSFYLQPVRVIAYKKALSNKEIPSSEIAVMSAISPPASPGVNGTNTSINQYVTVDNSGVNTSFDIDLPYTIPSDGQQHLVAIKKYEMPAIYRYYVAPKIDKDVFLQAQITNWEDLNLLPGATNIFYDGTYVGQGYMDVNNIKDTMTLSLGRDKKIIVKRDLDKKLRSVKTIGSNIHETFAYTISIRNARRENINLLVQDQQPLSTDKDIVIEDKNTGDAVYDETTGMMKWALSLNPNETRLISFGYSVKYPKGRTVSGLR
jgi:uncharacterized protein (TIGR02231 family)